MPVNESPCESLSYACLAANGALSLLNLACYCLDRQVERLAQNFENNGGFTERLYNVRSAKRRSGAAIQEGGEDASISMARKSSGRFGHGGR
jgi:four helix bundle suffix protein